MTMMTPQILKFVKILKILNLPKALKAKYLANKTLPFPQIKRSMHDTLRAIF